MSTTATAAKPAVIDSKGNTLELFVKVIFDGDSHGHITGLEHQRQRAVIQPADGGKKVVRPAAKVRVEKNRSGKVQRVERPARKQRATASAAA